MSHFPWSHRGSRIRLFALRRPQVPRPKDAAWRRDNFESALRVYGVYTLASGLASFGPSSVLPVFLSVQYSHSASMCSFAAGRPKRQLRQLHQPAAHVACAEPMASVRDSGCLRTQAIPPPRPRDPESLRYLPLRSRGMVDLDTSFVAAAGAVGKFCPANRRNRHGHGTPLELHCDVTHS